MLECQFRVSCCFWFQKSYTENIVEIGGNLFLRKYKIGKLPESEDHLGGAPQGPHAMGARPGVGPRPARVWWPWLAPGTHPSPIYPLDAKTLIQKTIFHEKFRRGHHRQSQIGGVLTFFPAPCRRGNHHQRPLHHHACLRSDA